MTHSSIGSGTASDSNENHELSKTMGAESEPSKSSEALSDAAQNEKSQPLLDEDALASSSDSVGAVPVKSMPNNPGDFPDGPNVAPSPWEQDAARGKV